MRKRKKSLALNKILFFLCFTLFLCLMSPLKIHAEENKTELKTVKVGYLLYEGYQEGAEGEPKSGYGYEYLQQVAYYANWKYEYVHGSFNELLNKLKNGEIDIMGNLSYTEERAQFINFAAEEQGREYYYLFVREDRSDILANDISTLNHMRVGINKGSIQIELFQKWCQENGIQCEIILYENSAERYDDMNNGKLDAIVSTSIANNDSVKYQWHSLVKIGSSPYYFGINKQREDLLNELNQATKQILQSDWYYNERVYLKYYGKSSVASSGLSQSEIDWLKEKQSIKIGYMKNTLPYSDEKDHQLIGLLNAFVNHLETRFHLTVETKGYDSFSAMQTDLNQGSIDFMFPIYGNYWIAEENNLMISEPLTTGFLLMLFDGEYDVSKEEVIAVTDTNSMQEAYVRFNYPQAEILKCNCFE